MPLRFASRESVRSLTLQADQFYAALERVVEMAQWSDVELQEFRMERLQDVLQHANDHVPLYSQKYAEAGFRPRDVRTLDDVHRIPVLTKDDLRGSLANLRATSTSGSARLLSSSGSTGVPSRIYRDEASLWQISAYNTWLYHQWCHGKPIAEVLYCIDLAQDSIDYALADLLRTTVTEERLIGVHVPADQLYRAVRLYSPRFMSSYPSTMRNLAVLLHRRGIVYDRLELLHLTSEMIDGTTRQLLRQVFPNARLVETYTSTEAGLVAFQCAAADRWHLAEELVMHEIVDEQNAPTDGLGRIVVTDLSNRATPIIRYQGLGDLCRWQDTPCQCGSRRRSISQLAGRHADSIVLDSGRVLSPYAIIDVMDEVDGVYQYQVVQQTSRQFEVFVVRDVSARRDEPDLQAKVAALFEQLFNEPAECRVQLVDRITPSVGQHKTPLVRSMVSAAS